VQGIFLDILDSLLYTRGLASVLLCEIEKEGFFMFHDPRYRARL